jgi:mycofactocin precursor
MGNDEAATLAGDETLEQQEAAAETDLVDELLIEEISIDGMCGVY